MDYQGSYRHLLKNAKSALLAAIEIYNKPRWLLKKGISKPKTAIYAPRLNIETTTCGVTKCYLGWSKEFFNTLLDLSIETSAS